MDKKGGYQDEEENSAPSAKDDSKSPKAQSSPPNRIRRERRSDADSKAANEQDDNEAAPSKPRRKRGSEEGSRGAGVGWMNTSSSPNKTLNNSIVPDDEALPAAAPDAANAVKYGCNKHTLVISFLITLPFLISANNKNKHFNDNEEGKRSFFLIPTRISFHSFFRCTVEVMIIPDLDEEAGADSDHRSKPIF